MARGKAGGYKNQPAFVDTKRVGVEDMVFLSSIEEDHVLNNLNQRFYENEIYTWIGNVLCVTNPFQWLPLYDAQHIKAYEGANATDLPPHVFAVAEAAFRQMLLEEEKQCIIISGESGAGKTEAAKQIMTYIAAVSGSGGNDKAVNKVKDIILDSNPAMEAFGNAMTVRNNNSSRFGKYFEIKFDLKNGGTPRGGTIINYLLERSRVCTPGPGERSFHIFYQLLASGDRNLLQEFHLSGDPDDYYLLSQTGCTEIDNEGGVKDDRKEWEETVESLNTVDIFEDDQENMFRIVAACLHLSNVQFMNDNSTGADGSAATDRNLLHIIADVLSINPEELEYALTHRTLNTASHGGRVETYQVPQNPTQATASKEAIMKDLYSRMFNLLVRRINIALETGGQNTRLSMRKVARNLQEDNNLSIGVLDIYGFEIFDTNMFEQFCINYVNEKLQQIFIELTIKAEQEEYQAEGIQWNPIPFFDNKVVCSLIEGKKPPGIFSVLDDATKQMNAMGGGSPDAKFIQQANSVHNNHIHFEKYSSDQFSILHYAGQVVYSTKGFVASNRDMLSQDLRLMFKRSNSDFIRSLYPENVDIDDKRNPTTASFKIKTQCADLVDTLMDCEPHYVRTIKSNSQKKPSVFEDDMVLHQIRYLGLLENIKVRRAGFAFRVNFKKFVDRYKVFALGKVDPKTFARGSYYEMTSAIMQCCAEYIPELQEQGAAQLGQTKLFVKNPEVYFKLQEERKKRLGAQCSKIQKAWRRYALRKDLVDLRQDMADMFEAMGKASTPTDLLRPYYSIYIEQKDINDAVSKLLEYYQAGQIKQEKLEYTDLCKRMDSNGKLERIVFVITDQAFYIAKWGKEPETKQQLKEGIRNKFELTLKRRTLLKNVRGISLSKEADDLIMIQVKPATKQNPDKKDWVDKKKVKKCMESQTPFSTFGAKKYQCHVTGDVFVKDFMIQQPLPDKGFYKAVDIHNKHRGVMSQETQEDVVLLSEKKAEVAAVIRDLVGKSMGIQPKAGGFNVDALRTSNDLPQCKALYRFEAEEDDELEFDVDDVIDILNTKDSEWWLGQFKGRKGVFPASYVEKIEKKPKRALKTGFAVDIQINNSWQVNSAFALSNNPGGTMSFKTDRACPQLNVKRSGGSTKVVVPYGVVGEKLRNIQRSQAARKRKKEEERLRLAEQQRVNAQKLAEQDAKMRERKLAEKKKKRMAEKNKRKKEKEAMEFSRNQAKKGGPSFASKIQQQRQGGMKTNNNSQPAWAGANGRVQPSQAAKNFGGGTGYVPQPAAKSYAPVAKPPPPQKSPWQTHYDEDSGLNYYYNPVTKESTWEKPPGVA